MSKNVPMTWRAVVTMSFSVVLISCTGAATLNREETAAGVKDAVSMHDYSVRVERASPVGGASINLTTYYTIDVHPQSVQAYLPYFGRATGVASYGSLGAVQLRTKTFQYKQSPTKFGWQITITPEASDDVREVTMDITREGNVTAKFNFKNRTPVDYLGYINLSKPRIDSTAFKHN